MKKTTVVEEDQAAFKEFFDRQYSAPGPVAPAGENGVLPDPAPPASRTSFLDNFVAALKFIFFFLPGAAVTVGTILAWTIFSFYGEFELELLLGSLGFLAGGTFLVMFSLNKLLDLRYLRVVGAMMLTGLIGAVFYGLVTALTGRHDHLGLFWLVMWVAAAALGHGVKRNLDEAELSTDRHR